MTRATSFATLILVILAVLSSVQANATGGSSSKAPGTGATTPIAGSTDAYMFELLTLVNQHRSSLGLKPLCLTAGLINAAIIHAQDMANKQYMDHAGSDGSTPFTRMEKAGYVGFGYAAENIAYGSVGGSLKFETAAAVFKTWIESKGHRENIELPQVNQMGAGRAQGTCVGGSGTCEYHVQNFGQNDVNVYKCLTPGGGGGSTTTVVTPNPPSKPSQPPQQPSQPPQQPSQPPQQPPQPPQQPTATPTPQPPRTRTRITYTRQPVPTTVITTPPRQPDHPGYPGQKPPVVTSLSATAIVTATATATATTVPSPPSDESPRKSTPVADPPKYTTTADVPVALPTSTATAIATVTAPANPGYPNQPNQPQPPAPTTPIAPEPTTPAAPQPPTTPVNPQPSNPTMPQPQPPTGGDNQTPGKPTPTRRPRRKCKCTCEGSDGKKTTYTTGY
ncbi:hypothetical protein GGF31_005568 [Allomyces arbusculus]|nr:hypothetical protein GGF31_005568 [Allomyces arbusculus]